MAFYEAHNVQFLDLNGVDEEEKNWILASLQTRDATVKGPWNKIPPVKHDIRQVCTEAILPAAAYYSTTGVVISNHAMGAPAVYPAPPQAAFQQPIVYPPAFVTPPYQPMVVNAPVVPVVVPVVPVNNQYPPTYQTYPNTFSPTIVNAVPIAEPPIPQALNVINLYNPINPPVINSMTPVKADVVISIPDETVNNVHTVTNGLKHDEKIDKVEEIEKIEPQTNASNGGAKSWASLFNKGGPGASPIMGTVDDENKTPVASPFTHSAQNKAPLASGHNPNYYRMAETLIDYQVDHRITSLQPRGLINHSNYCYINSILQALLACPPFYNLLRGLADNVTTKDTRKRTQIIDNMIRFVREFRYLPSGQRVTRRAEGKPGRDGKKEAAVTSVNCDRPFEPFWIYKMLNGMRSDSFVVEGRQEDAEEFLGCLLNGLNDEMLDLMKLLGEQGQAPGTEEPSDLSDGDKEWQVIGPKNKGSVTRRTEIVRTPISDIFGGHIRSRVHRTGDQITDNIQPFFTLQLNIEKVTTVREALEALVCKNQLEGLTSSRTNEEVEAWQQVTLEELPIVLVLHLKCFDFKLDGCTKIVKALEFPVDLKIDSKLLSSKTNYQAKEKQYKLFAVVYHDGKEATKGHYITDAYHVGYASWIRYDDAGVKPVLEEHVLKPYGSKVPYLLFYRRTDTVRSK